MVQNVIRLTKLYYKKHLLLLATGKDDITHFIKNETLKDAVLFLMLACNQLQNPMKAINEDDDVPLSLLLQQILQDKYKKVYNIQGLLQVVIPEGIYIEHDIDKWNTIEADQPIDLDKDAEDTEESGHDVQDEGQIGNPIKATEAIKSFDKDIAWAETNTSDNADILILSSIREKVISEHRKQISIREFFQ